MKTLQHRSSERRIIRLAMMRYVKDKQFQFETVQLIIYSLLVGGISDLAGELGKKRIHDITHYLGIVLLATYLFMIHARHVSRMKMNTGSDEPLVEVLD